MDVALPELPDDRRAQPRRYGPADSPEAGRASRNGESPGSRHAPAAPSWDLDGVPADVSSTGGGRRRLIEEPENGPVSGPIGAAVGGHVNGADNGRGRYRGEPPRSAAEGTGELRRPAQPREGGGDVSATGGRRRLREPGHSGAQPVQPPQGQRPPSGVHDSGAMPPPGRMNGAERINGTGGVSSTGARRRTAAVSDTGSSHRVSDTGRHAPRRPAERGDEHTPPPGRRAVRDPQAPAQEPSQIPPQRRPRRADPHDDSPTEVIDTSEVPGRHRRRAGASPEGRPASEYSEQAAKSGRRTRAGGRRRRPAFWKELPLLIVVALLLTFLIQTFLAKVYVIPSGSMETTLHGCTGCNNDRVLVDKISLRFSDPQPGDVVVFRGPDSWNSEITVDPPSNFLVRVLQQFGSLIGLAPPDEKDFVKRVIAVGGQTVQCCDDRNRVTVDGQPLNEPYIYFIPDGRIKQEPFAPVTVPQGQLWMMGDSRNNSADSRAPNHGPVPVANVIGKARLIVLPFSRFGWISSVDPHAAAVGMGETGGGAGVPLALGMLGTLPFAFGRRRLRMRAEQLASFLPGR